MIIHKSCFHWPWILKFQDMRLVYLRCWLYKIMLLNIDVFLKLYLFSSFGIDFTVVIRNSVSIFSGFCHFLSGLWNLSIVFAGILLSECLCLVEHFKKPGEWRQRKSKENLICTLRFLFCNFNFFFIFYFFLSLSWGLWC